MQLKLLYKKSLIELNRRLPKQKSKQIKNSKYRKLKLLNNFRKLADNLSEDLSEDV